MTTSLADRALGATPSWISSLKGSVLRSDFKSFAATGKIAKAEAARALTDLEDELTTPGTTLSQSQTMISSADRALPAAPSWISNLKDSVLRSDFTSFAEAGKITEAEMAKALTDLDGELKKNKTTLSQSQMTDLQTIAKNIASLGASSYLRFITNAFVDGNAANATWTGGGIYPVALGNLASGYTVVHLNELIGKWFLGTDLPSGLFIDNATTPWTNYQVHYSTVTKPVFGAGGEPTIADVNQGQAGNCYLLASLAEVASQDPSAIKSMITDNGDGTYGVGFYVGGKERYVTVNRDLAQGGTFFNSGANIWASLIEQAYAEVQAQGVITGATGGEGSDEGNSFTTIGNGGQEMYSLEEITDATKITDFASNGSTWTAHAFNQSLQQTGSTPGQTNETVLSTLVADLDIGDDVLLGSETDATQDGKATLVGNHAMSICGYDAATGKLQIFNPQGTAAPGQPQDWKTTFEVSLDTLLKAYDPQKKSFDSVYADNVGTATSVAGAAVVAAPALQTMSQVRSFSVTDDVADVDSGLSGLIADSKLTSVSVDGTSGADSLDLTGLNVPATIALDGDSDAATIGGFVRTGTGTGRATNISLGGDYDAAALGNGSATIDVTLGSACGVEAIAAFNTAHDLLSIVLNGASLEQTLVGGGDWISSSTDLSHGVFLTDVSRLQKVTVSGGVATVA